MYILYFINIPSSTNYQSIVRARRFHKSDSKEYFIQTDQTKLNHIHGRTSARNHKHSTLRLIATRNLLSMSEGVLKHAADDEARRKDEKPVVTVAEAIAAAKELYGLEIAEENVSKVKQLDSYDDRNFFMQGSLPSSNGAVASYLFKVHNGVESDRKEFLSCQNAIMSFLSSNGFACPSPIASRSGEDIEYLELDLKVAKEDGQTKKNHAVRLLSWVEGKPLSTVEVSSEKLVCVGRYLGRMMETLRGFDHPGARRVHLWDQKNTNLIRPYIETIDEEDVKKIVYEVVDDFEATVLPIQDTSLRQGIIQGDYNDANIIMGDGDDVSGIIDFGDMSYSNIVCDLSIGMAYAMLTPPKDSDGLSAACAVFEGFSEMFDLEEAERDSLRTLIAARVATSVTLGAFSISKDPENEYLKLHAKPGRVALVNFWQKWGKEEVETRIDEAGEKGRGRRKD